MVNGFYCTNIFSANAKALIAFYRDVLEIPVQKTDMDDYNGVYFGFIKDAPTLCVWDAEAFSAPVSGNMSFVFSCADLDKTIEELANKGIQLEPPVKYDWGTYELRLKDPDNNEIVIAEFMDK